MKYKLEGHDQEFVTSFSNEPVVYSNLKPGSYTLRASAFNADGVQGKSEYTLDIVVKNPFWQSTGAFILYFLTALLIL